MSDILRSSDKDVFFERPSSSTIQELLKASQDSSGSSNAANWKQTTSASTEVQGSSHSQLAQGASHEDAQEPAFIVWLFAYGYNITGTAFDPVSSSIPEVYPFTDAVADFLQQLDMGILPSGFPVKFPVRNQRDLNSKESSPSASLGFRRGRERTAADVPNDRQQEGVVAEVRDYRSQCLTRRVGALHSSAVAPSIRRIRLHSVPEVPICLDPSPLVFCVGQVVHYNRTAINLLKRPTCLQARVGFMDETARATEVLRPVATPLWPAVSNCKSESATVQSLAENTPKIPPVLPIPMPPKPLHVAEEDHVLRTVKFSAPVNGATADSSNQKEGKEVEICWCVEHESWDVHIHTLSSTGDRTSSFLHGFTTCKAATGFFYELQLQYIRHEGRTVVFDSDHKILDSIEPHEDLSVDELLV
eukprot:m.279865 g.279865  ORF g.279865 m.279865 type:complete len:417 (-) comp19814_c0_seq7:253-1503(-)